MTKPRASADHLPPESPDPRPPSFFITPIIVFVILVLGIILASLVIYQQEQSALLRETEERLSAVSRLQARRLGLWRRERLTDATVLASERTLGQLAAARMRHPENREALANIRHSLDVMKMGYGFYSVQVLDDSARILASATGDHPLVGSRMPLLIREVPEHGRAVLTDFHDDSVGVPVTPLDVLVPLDLSGITSVSRLYLLLRVDPTAFLFPFLESVDASLTTPTTEFVRSEGRLAVALVASPSKEHPGDWLTFSVDSLGLPEVRAVHGERGFFRATDHHGRQVYVYVTDVEDMPWAVLALFPEKVIRNPLRARAEAMGFFITLFTLASAFAIFFLWSRDLKVSERRESESRARLTESQDLYHQLFAGMYQGVLYLDDGGNVIDANPSAIRILRLPAKVEMPFNLRGMFHAVMQVDPHHQSALP
jgi:PAS domain-containing protein